MWMRIASLLWVLCLCSCDTPQTPSLTTENRELVDSLYLSAAREYNQMHDSLCDTYRNLHLQVLVDSMQQIRLLEITKMLER